MSADIPSGVVCGGAADVVRSSSVAVIAFLTFVDCGSVYGGRRGRPAGDEVAARPRGGGAPPARRYPNRVATLSGSAGRSPGRGEFVLDRISPFLPAVIFPAPGAGGLRSGLQHQREGQMNNRHSGPALEDVTVGVIGAENFLHRLTEVARTEVRTPYRLVTASDDHAGGVQEKARRLAEDVDVLLFSGPLPYDLAVAGDPLPVPATFIPTGGVALPTALLRGVVTGTVDTRRVSIDSAHSRQVRETYAELDLPMRHVHVIEYHESVSAEEFLTFHTEHYRAGSTKGAITTVPQVAAELTDAGIPNLTMAAAPLTIRSALRTARLLGSGARMEDSRIAIVIVRLPTSALPNRTSSSNFWFQELKLSLHRTLLHEARRMDAAVLQRDEQSYLVITTMGSLRTGTEDRKSVV